MKTKLLKIVRKRFSITRFDHVENPDSILYGHKMPIWRVEDKYGSDWSTRYEKTYEEAYLYLIMWIKSKYYSDVKCNRDKYEKVWYNERKNI